jgi:L-idonate 5-dehydrogenase
VALHGVQRAGPLLGKRVLVSGCGPIGTLSIAAARVHGASEIVAVDVTDETLAIARAMGADLTLNVARDTGWVQRYGADGRTRKGSFDVMLECSGNGLALRAGLEVMRPRGTVVQLGLGGDVSIPQNMVVAKELSICGSFRFHAEFALAVRLINEGRVDLRPMVTAAFPLSQARQAFELASDRTKSMKVLLDFAAEAVA